MFDASLEDLRVQLARLRARERPLGCPAKAAAGAVTAVPLFVRDQCPPMVQADYSLPFRWLVGSSGDGSMRYSSSLCCSHDWRLELEVPREFLPTLHRLRPQGERPSRRGKQCGQHSNRGRRPSDHGMVSSTRSHHTLGNRWLGVHDVTYGKVAGGTPADDTRSDTLSHVTSRDSRRKERLGEALRDSVIADVS